VALSDESQPPASSAGHSPSWFLHALGLTHRHPSVFLLPAVIGLPGDSQLPPGSNYRETLAEQYLGLTQLLDDPFGFECLSDR